MYVSNQCGMRNSTSPITQAMIDGQNARMNARVQVMSDGNSDMADLIAALTPPSPTGNCDDLTNSIALIAGSPWPVGGGPAESSPATVAGPASGVPGAVAASPSPAGVTASGTPAASGSSVATYGRGRGRRGSPFFGHARQRQAGRQISNFSCAGPGAPSAAGAAKVIPVPAIATPSAPTPSAPSAPAWQCPGQAQCRTSNICLDLKRGCVASSQVTQQQIEACAAAGYTGNEDFFPCAIGPNQNLPFLGAPMPNPPPYSTVAAQDVPPPASQNWWGLGGLGCGDNMGVLQVLGIALGVGLGIYFADWASKQNWGMKTL